MFAHCWVLWVLCLMLCELSSFPVWWQQVIFSALHVCALYCSFWSFLVVIFLALGHFFIHVLVNSLFNIWRDLQQIYRFSLYEAIFFPDTLFSTPVTLVSLDFQLHLLNSRGLLGSSWAPVLALWKLSQDSILRQS